MSQHVAHKMTDPVMKGRVENTVLQLARFIDSGRADRVIESLHEEVVLEFGPGSPAPGRLVGLDAVSEFFVNRANNKALKTRHIITNMMVLQKQDGDYEARYCFTVYRGQDGSCQVNSQFIADVVDVYAPSDDDVFHLKMRVISPVFICDNN